MSIERDPFYRALLADIADTEWQAVESDFLRDRDDAEVSLKDARDVEFWTLELGVSERELRRAIGVSVNRPGFRGGCLV